MIHVIPVDLLRRHVLDAPHQLPGFRDIFRANPGNSEIHQLDGAILQQHYVSGFDVAVNNALLMRIRQSIANLDHNAQFFFQEQGSAGAEGYIQALAFEKLHHEVWHGLVDPKVINGDNVRVLKLARGLRFPIEAFYEYWIIDDRTGHHLDANQSPDFRIDGLVDDSHAASAHDSEHLVFTQLFGCVV